MTVKFKVNFSQSGQFPGPKDYVRQMVSTMTLIARDEWIKAARENLRTTAKEYIAGIGEPNIKGNVGEIKLEGWMPNALETGLAPFDMKPGLLGGPKAKAGKKGPYTTVPLAMKAPGGGDRGPSPPVMPRPIYRMAAAQQFGKKLTLPKKYENLGLKTRLSPDTSKWGHYTWKNSPFQGIQKTRKTPGSNKGKYSTFRRVSGRSNPNSWIHPGFKAKNLMEIVAQRIETKFPEVLNSMPG